MKAVLLFLISFIFLTAGCRLFDKTAPVAPQTDNTYISTVITSPPVGAIITKGSTLSIKWTGFKTEKVTLELWKKKAYNQQTIASDFQNTGSYNWLVPAQTAASVSYQVKLISAENPSEYIYSDVFTIK